MWDEYIIVDDNKFDRLICLRIVQKMDPGARYIEYADGEELYHYITSDAFVAKKALIFLDINMPRMSGFDFIAKLFEHPNGEKLTKRMNVAFITSSSRTEDRAQAASFDFTVGYIQKPLMADRIADAVMRVS